MCQDNPLNWPKEEPEDYKDKHLFYRAIKDNLWMKFRDLDKIEPNFFMIKESEKGLSVDWSKYSEPRETLNRMIPPDLNTYGIAKINVGDFRTCVRINNFNLTIEHYPIKTSINNLKLNRSHTLIHGINKENKAKVRKKISKITCWVEGLKPIIKP